jgi:hypothetical protein
LLIVFFPFLFIQKLEEAVSDGLKKAGVSTNDIIYPACFEKLSFVTKFYAKVKVQASKIVKGCTVINTNNVHW